MTPEENGNSGEGRGRTREPTGTARENRGEKRERRIELAEEREKQQADQREVIRKQELTDEKRRVLGQPGGARQEEQVRRDLEDKGPYFQLVLLKGEDSGGEVGKQGSGKGGERISIDEEDMFVGTE